MFISYCGCFQVQMHVSLVSENMTIVKKLLILIVALVFLLPIALAFISLSYVLIWAQEPADLANLNSFRITSTPHTGLDHVYSVFGTPLYIERVAETETRLIYNMVYDGLIISFSVTLDANDFNRASILSLYVTSEQYRLSQARLGVGSTLRSTRLALRRRGLNTLVIYLDDNIKTISVPVRFNAIVRFTFDSTNRINNIIIERSPSV